MARTNQRIDERNIVCSCDYICMPVDIIDRNKRLNHNIDKRINN